MLLCREPLCKKKIFKKLSILLPLNVFMSKIFLFTTLSSYKNKDAKLLPFSLAAVAQLHFKVLLVCSKRMVYAKWWPNFMFLQNLLRFVMFSDFILFVLYYFVIDTSSLYIHCSIAVSHTNSKYTDVSFPLLLDF